MMTLEVDMQFPVCHTSYFSMSYNKLEPINKIRHLVFQSLSSIPAKAKDWITRMDESLSKPAGATAALLPLTLRCRPADGVPVWTVPKSPSGELLKNGGVTPLRSAEPSPALSKRSVCSGAEVSSVPAPQSGVSNLFFCLFYGACVYFFLYLLTYSWKWTTELIHGQCCWD